MKRLVPKGDGFRYWDEVERIVEACRNNGYLVSAIDARWAWEKHSHDRSASWLVVNEGDDVITNHVRHYLDEEDVPEFGR